MLLGMAIANLFLADINQTRSSGSLLISGSRSTEKAHEISLQPQNGNNAMEQQLINSGQLNPPPGNPDKMYSIAVPFSNTMQVSSTGMTQASYEIRQVQLGWSQRDILISAKQSNTAAVASSSQNGQSAVDHGQTAPTQTQALPNVFDTPPGIGSSLGGR